MDLATRTSRATPSQRLVRRAGFCGPTSRVFGERATPGESVAAPAAPAAVATNVSTRPAARTGADAEDCVAGGIERRYPTRPRSKLEEPVRSPLIPFRIGRSGPSGRRVRGVLDEERETRRAGWRLMRDAVRPLKVLVWMGILAGLVWTGARVAIPSLTGAAIDEGIVPGNFDVALEWTGIILAVGVIQAICTGLRRYAAFRLAYRVETDLRMRLVAHLQRLHFAFHDHAQTGQLMANANTDIQQIQQVVLLIPLTIASVLTMIAVVDRARVAQSAVSRCSRSRRCRSSTSRRRASRAACIPVGLSLQEELADFSGVVEESVSGVRVVKGFGAERLQERNLADRSRRRLRPLDRPSPAARELPAADRSPADARSRRHPLVRRPPGARRQPLGRRHRRGELLRADADLAAADGRHAARPAVARGRLGRPHQHGARHRARDRGRRRAPRPLPDGPGAVAVRRRHVRLRTGPAGARRPRPRRFAAARRSPWSAPPRRGRRPSPASSPASTTSTAGRSASTAPTCARPACSDVRRAVGHRVRGHVPLLRHACAATSRSPIPRRPTKQVVRAARLAGADEFVRDLPDGYDTIVGEHGYSLSGGQRQRIAIARAVLADPRILILDDATSSVDPSKEHEIRSALARGDARPHDDHHRPPPRDDRARRPRRAARRRHASSPTARTTSCSRRTPRYREVLARAEADELARRRVDDEDASRRPAAEVAS